MTVSELLQLLRPYDNDADRVREAIVFHDGNCGEIVGVERGEDTTNYEGNHPIVIIIDNVK